MLLDKLVEFSDGLSTVLTAGATPQNLGDVIDLGPSGRGIGAGEPVYLVISLASGIDATGPGTVQFRLVSDDIPVPDPATATLHLLTPQFATSTTSSGGVLRAGRTLFVATLPMEGNVYERYLGVQVVVGGTNTTAGQVDAFLTLDVACWKSYFATSNAAMGAVDTPLTVKVAGLLGQSNEAGRGVYNAGIDTTNANILQWDDRSDSGTFRTLILAADPMKHPETTLTAVGPGMFFAKGLLTGGADKVVLVPLAWGGTALVGASAPWSASGADTGSNPAATGLSVLYWNAIHQMNLAVAAAQAQFPGATIEVLYQVAQGEADGDNLVTEATYLAAFTAWMSGMRTLVTGASNAPVVINQMVPEGITYWTALGKSYSAIDRAHQVYAGTTNYCNFSAIGLGYNTSADKLHYDAPGVRLQGTTGAELVPAARLRTSSILPGAPVNLQLVSAASTSVSLTSMFPLDGGTTNDFIWQYRVAGSGTWLTFSDGASTTPSATITGLTPVTDYEFSNLASNGVGTGARSNVVLATTGAAVVVSSVRLTTIADATHVFEQVDGDGYDYGVSDPGADATFAASHAGTSSKSLPAGVDGYFEVPLPTTGYNAGKVFMLGLVSSASDPAYNSGSTTGYLYAVYSSSPNFSLKSQGSATTITATTAVASGAGKVMRLQRVSGVLSAIIDGVLIYTFPVANNNQLWCAMSFNDTSGVVTAVYTGKLVGGNVT